VDNDIGPPVALASETPEQNIETADNQAVAEETAQIATPTLVVELARSTLVDNTKQTALDAKRASMGTALADTPAPLGVVTAEQLNQVTDMLGLQVNNEVNDAADTPNGAYIFAKKTDDNAVNGESTAPVATAPTIAAGVGNLAGIVLNSADLTVATAAETPGAFRESTGVKSGTMARAA
jgi:hypothetical protein